MNKIYRLKINLPGKDKGDLLETSGDYIEWYNDRVKITLPVSNTMYLEEIVGVEKLILRIVELEKEVKRLEESKMNIVYYTGAYTIGTYRDCNCSLNPNALCTCNIKGPITGNIYYGC